jgi:hypothetical protein
MYWIAAAVLLGVFCWQPGPFVSLVWAVAGVGAIAVLTVVLLRYPQEVRDFLVSIPNRPVTLETRFGKFTLSAQELSDLDREVKRMAGETVDNDASVEVSVGREMDNG